MRAAVFQGIGLGHKIEIVADPSPSTGEIVIRVDRSGICSTDLTMTAPRLQPSPLGAHFESICRPGTILGHEFAGEVIALGAGVRRLQAGDRIAPLGTFGCGHCLTCVAGKPHRCAGAYAKMGGYAEYGIVREQFCVRLSPAISLDEGALIEPMACSLHAVALAGLGAGTRVAVIGAGPIGLGIIHFARRSGARRIVAITRSERHRELARTLGADVFLVQGPDTNREMTEHLGAEADVVFETSGAPGTIDQAVACVRPAGTIVAMGVSLSPDTVVHTMAIMKEVRLQYAVSYTLEEFEILADMLARGDSPLRKLVTKHICLDEFPAIFEELRTTKTACKVALIPCRTFPASPNT